MNKCSGVVGVFNCQGAGWCKVVKKVRIHDASPGTLSGSVSAADVDSIPQVAGADWNGEVVVYSYRSGNNLFKSIIVVAPLICCRPSVTDLSRIWLRQTFSKCEWHV